MKKREKKNDKKMPLSRFLTKSHQSSPFKNPGGVPGTLRTVKSEGQKSLCLIYD